MAGCLIRISINNTINPIKIMINNTAEQTVNEWADFNAKWDGIENFRMAGDCLPFEINLPPLERVIEEVRLDEKVLIGSGAKGNLLSRENLKEQFLARPVDEAIRAPFSITHFELSRFDRPGSFFHGVYKEVMEPWTAALRQQGFTWDRCNPLMFISGVGCATNYHMDYSQVLACQVYGTKRFCGTRDPERWAPQETRLTYNPEKIGRPDDLTEEDAICYLMEPKDVLWNTLLTPHWVEAGEQVALSINISHGGLRRNGRLCKNEQELIDFRALQKH